MILKVEQWMTREVVSVGRHDNIALVAELMRKNNIGAVVVCDGDHPAGIITERDIIRKVVAQKKNPEQESCETIMSHNLISVDKDTEIKEVTDKMVRYNIKKMPIVDNGRLSGIITSTDIVRTMSQLNKLYDAKDLMNLGA